MLPGIIIDKLEKDRMFYDLYRMEIKTLRLISIISKVLCFQLNFWLLAYLLQSVLRWHLLILPLLFFHLNLRRIFHEEKLFYSLCYYNKVIYLSKFWYYEIWITIIFMSLECFSYFVSLYISAFVAGRNSAVKSCAVATNLFNEYLT